ncbi:MAG: TylF/MycF/NovP-related O-methyltransferase [Burkholderiales bacterium]
MGNFLLRGVRSLIRRAGMDVVRYRRSAQEAPPIDFDPAAVATIRRVQPYTMTSPERLFSLIEAVRYISRAAIAGDVVECGVWRGGSMMAAALTLVEEGDRERDLYLVDTFEGMSAPSEHDVAVNGTSASFLLDQQDKFDPDSAWCYATLDEVRAAMATIGYDMGRMHFIQGKVEDTIPEHAPHSIAMLRLDTDWYESTRHELEHLYPRLSPGGVLIIDDYGHWKGCRQAVDEYFEARNIRLLLNRVDYTGRIAVKPA